MRQSGYAAVAALAALSLASAAETKVWLDELPVKDVEVGWGEPRVNRSVDGRPMKIGTRSFERGLGVHAFSRAFYRIEGGALRFDAEVGVDAEVYPGVVQNGKSVGGLKFRVYADDRLVAESPVLGRATSPEESVKISASLQGAKTVELVVEPEGEISFDHADWANACFTLEDGAKVVPGGETCPQLGILTPKSGPEPRINGPRVLGARPGSPIVWRLPVSGQRPVKLAAEGLPAGLGFNPENGILSGAVAEAGEYPIRFTAVNSAGRAESTLKLKVGRLLALTPPMGWNSWNCFADKVTAEKVKIAAEAMVASGLADHGWNYVNIDDFWQNRPGEKNDPTLMGPERGDDGVIAVNKRFPDMKGLADYVHSLGLRIGLYSSPGPLTCGGCTGSWKHEWLDAKTYADWGFDYLKYDWCSYNSVAVGSGHAKFTLPYRLMGEALAAQKRDIVFSLCQYGMGNVSTWGGNVNGQCWRTTGDITDTWNSMHGILEQQADLWPYAGPGAWNDPDMLVVGSLGWGKLHPTRLTPNEQYTHISMWAILSAPLLIGCDLAALDEFTFSLLSNDEVIEVNQDELGLQAARIAEGPRGEIWGKPMSDGSLVFALVNDAPRPSPTLLKLDFASLGLEGRWKVRDLWRQADLGEFEGKFECEVPGHATTLVRLFPAAGGRLREGLRDIRDNAVYGTFISGRNIDKPGYTAPDGYPCSRCDKKEGEAK